MSELLERCNSRVCIEGDILIVIQNDFGERNVKNENLTDRRSDEPSWCTIEAVVIFDQVPDHKDGGNQEQDRRYDRIHSFLKTKYE
jgi:hypothetical protein